MSRTLIAVTDSPFPSLDPAKAALKRIDPELRMAKSPSADDILAVARDADAILVTYAKLPGELLRQLTRCKAIGRFGLGVDNIDIKAAAELGITVTYVPDYCMHEVSDHAMALLLALARKVPLSNTLVQAGRWEMPAVVPIHRLDRTRARPGRLRQHSARAGAEGQGVRAAGRRPRSLHVAGGVCRRRRRRRELRPIARRSPTSSRFTRR